MLLARTSAYIQAAIAKRCRTLGTFVTLLTALLVAGCVPLVKWELEEHLGSRPYANIIQNAEKQNWQALDTIGQPKVLVDIPATAVVPILRTELSNAISNATVTGGWTIKAVGDPTIAFIPQAIEATQVITLSNGKWGSATLKLTVDAIPHLTGADLTVDTAITNVNIVQLNPFGIYLPGFVDSNLSDALDASVDSLNTLMPSRTIANALPSQLVQQDLSVAAILVTPNAVTVMIGSPGTRPQGNSYADEYLTTARSLAPNYAPGSGIIASVDASQNFVTAAEQLRKNATSVNLAATETLLNLQAGFDPSTLGLNAVARSVLISASSDWLSTRLRLLAIDAISKFHSPGVELVVAPDDVKVKIIDGALEVTVGGTAKFTNNKLSVAFSAIGWAVVQPNAGGIEVRYALRELDIKNVTVDWDNRVAAFNVPYQAALGSLIAQFIGTLPTTNVPIPQMPINIKASADKEFRVVFSQGTTPAIDFTGRAFLLSPRRVDVLVSPKLANGATVVSAASITPPATDQFAILDTLISKVETLLNGSLATRQLEVMAAKQALGSLLETLFTTLNPHIEAQYSSTQSFDAGRIKAIPGNGSCNIPCQGVSICGDIAKCTVNVCSTVVAGTVCNTFCPQFVPGCSQICKPVTNKICGPQADNDCLNRVNSCVSGITQCTAAWGSGFEATCRATLGALNAAGFTGLVEVSGNVALNMSGETQKDAQLKIQPDLNSLDLSLVASGSATADASANIVWIQFGNLLLCPSGKLTGHFSLTAAPQSENLHAGIEWTGGGTSPVLAVVTPDDPTVALQASTPPIQTLVASNPGLLTCSLGQAVVGLGVLSMPHVTQDLLAGALRKALGGDSGAIAGAIIDGRYSYTGHLSQFSFEIPSTHYDLGGQDIDLSAALTSVALTMSTAN